MRASIAGKFLQKKENETDSQFSKQTVSFSEM